MSTSIQPSVTPPEQPLIKLVFPLGSIEISRKLGEVLIKDAPLLLMVAILVYFNVEQSKRADVNSNNLTRQAMQIELIRRDLDIMVNGRLVIEVETPEDPQPTRTRNRPED